MNNLPCLEVLVSMFEAEDKGKWYEDYTNYDTYKQKYLRNHKNIFLVAEHDTYKGVGFIMGYERNPYVYAVGINYVIPSFRGMGVAYRLKQGLVDKAKKAGYVEIWSDVAVDNISSVSLNFRSGWKPDYLSEWNVYRFKKKLI